MTAPRGFVEAVERARRATDCGQLALLREEIETRPWAGAARHQIRHAEEWAGCHQDSVATLVFSGHMIDAPGRTNARFPPEAEPSVNTRLTAAIAAEHRARPVGLAVAGAASGGDILFLEAAQQLGIVTRILLPGPPDEFAARSVAPAGRDWLARFEAVCSRSPPAILHDHLELPEWLASTVDYSVWERNNRWILATAVEAGGETTTLIALWDGQQGDGRGGTAHMVDQALARGLNVVTIDPRA